MYVHTHTHTHTHTRTYTYCIVLYIDLTIWHLPFHELSPRLCPFLGSVQPTYVINYRHVPPFATTHPLQIWTTCRSLLPHGQVSFDTYKHSLSNIPILRRRHANYPLAVNRIALSLPVYTMCIYYKYAHICIHIHVYAYVCMCVHTHTNAHTHSHPHSISCVSTHAHLYMYCAYI